MPVRVKICGITNLEDARAAVHYGADALGFIFFPRSPRYLDPLSAAAIIAELPPFVAKVGVFVDEQLEDILKIVHTARIDTIQLHGSEPPALSADLASTQAKVIKAFRIKDAATLNEIGNYRASAYLLDSYVPGQLGGTGARFNWDLALKAGRFETPIILAGGLDPENVTDAVSKVAPYGVDVSSGVETIPGKKDPEKVRLFIARAKQHS
jgi:phosphoribosylanthranilate isomerase